MNNNILALLISFIAGLSTTLGSIFIWIKPKSINNFIGTSLSFSGTIMILISLTELLPEGFFYIKYKYNIIYAILSLIIIFLIARLLNILINKKIKNKASKNVNLYRIGVLSMIALMIHNLPEGILTYVSSKVDLKLGIKLALAIMLHNVPEGIAIAVPIYYSTNSKKRGVEGAFISGLSEPLGAILAALLLSNYLTNTLVSIILLFVASIMINISINDIFEEANKYPRRSIILGIILGVITTLTLNFFF